jgi:DNA topoisomerase-3
VQLVIAEKPSVARDLARVLGVRGTGKHAIEGQGRVLTWCIGHLVELEEPAAYDGRWKAWRLDTLPMLPSAFKLRAVDGTRDQLRAVSGLLTDRRFKEVVNACDAGREGELIFRYVYELAGSRLPIRRLWISSLTDEAVRAGFGALRPGVDYDPLAAAARCRSEADWLVGMNATRAVTVSARDAAPRARPSRPPQRGRHGKSDSPLYSIGRVQTPTLAIVVRRELEIRNFVPRDYWEIRGVFTPVSSADGATEKVQATWGVAAPDGKAVRTRLGERALADGVVARDQADVAAGGERGAVVERLRQKKVKEPPPLLFDLTSLQRTANKRYGLSASATLAAAQALYERYKILTYPRTDSRHLTSDMAKELSKTFGALAAVADYEPFARPLLDTPPAQSKRVFDNGKVSDHHAIIPTGKPVNLNELPRDERRIFDLVARRFLGAFHPDAEFAATDVVIRVGAPVKEEAASARGGDAPADDALLATLPPPPDRYRARGRVRLVAGWQAVAQMGDGKRDDEEDAAALPPLEEGQRLVARFEVLTKQTRPPPRHTEATLLGAMESAGKEIEDEELRAAMRDSGLGTPATRAATIETLVKRTFVGRDGKNLVPTEMGIGLIEALPVKSLASPELTGAWEARLARIARGQDTRPAFMADISRYVGEVVTAIRGGRGPQASGLRPQAPDPEARGPKPEARAAAPKPATAPTDLPCPSCKQGRLVAGNRGWGCSRWREGCAFVIWFQIAGRRITDAELGDLVSKGKTRKRKWRADGGGEVSARLVLDLEAPREAGAARLAAD